MSVQILGLKEINGPLVVLDGVKGVGFDEMAELVLDNGTWRNYLQLDCLFWAKTNQDAAISADNSGKAFDLEVELSIEGNTENDTYTVESFTVEGVRLLSSAVSANNFTVKSSRYGALPMKKRKGGIMYGK